MLNIRHFFFFFKKKKSTLSAVSFCGWDEQQQWSEISYLDQELSLCVIFIDLIRNFISRSRAFLCVQCLWIQSKISYLDHEHSFVCDVYGFIMTVLNKKTLNLIWICNIHVSVWWTEMINPTSKSRPLIIFEYQVENVRRFLVRELGYPRNIDEVYFTPHKEGRKCFI